MRPQFPQGEMERKRSGPKGRPSFSRDAEGRKQSLYQMSMAETPYSMSREKVRQESMWGKY